MPLASSSYSYPLLGAFWTIFEIFLWVIWFWILITVFIDIFRSHDLSGWAKALWFLFVLLIPLIGVLVYLIARGGKMHERTVRQAQTEEREFRSYGQQAAWQGSFDPSRMADLERTAWVAYYRRRWLRLAVAADDFEHVGVPALWPALHDAERLAPQDHRPAMAGPVQGLHACRLRRLCLRS